MKIAYYTTIPPPLMPGTESVFNEIGILMDNFNGQMIHLYPFKKPYPRFPWQMVGLHRFHHLQYMDRIVDIHHIFSAGICPFPVLRMLRKPVVYTVVSGIDPLRDTLKWPGFMLVVGSERDLTTAKKLGITNCSFVHHGIDTSQIRKNPLILKEELTLLTASAPWTARQFRQKGFDLLFDLVSRRNDLRLIILMRGLLTGALQKRLKLFDIEDRVTVIDTYVDINAILSRVHATIALAENPGVIRSYPHSLIESLVAGKPIILSDTIPMADYARGNNVGCVVEDFSSFSLNATIDAFIGEYNTYRMKAEAIGGKDFSKDQMIADYHEVYDLVLRRM
jgi:glycosyltransferase involved in cell wall biosynthesis